MQRNRKKKFMFVIIIQFIAIYCGMLFWTLKFNSHTSAAFNDVEYLSFEVKADWSTKDKDKSSLRFMKHEVNCHTRFITAVIQNASTSSHMKKSAKYEVYWSNNRTNPKHHGQKLHSGTVPALRSGETYMATFKVTQPGQYVFKVIYSNLEIWSEVIHVDKKCLGNPKGKHQSSPNTHQTMQEPIEEKTLPPKEQISENANEPSETNDLQESSMTEDTVQEEGDEKLDESLDSLD